MRYMNFRSVRIALATIALLCSGGDYCAGIEEAVCINVENSLVHAYLQDANTSYSETIGRTGVSVLNATVLGDDVAYYLSQVGTRTERVPEWTEQPTSFTVPSKGGTSVLISDRPLFQTSLTYPATGDETAITNLVPQKVYWYLVLNSKGQTIRHGIIKVVGQQRMLKVDNVMNVRDLGGWETTDGSSMIAYGKIIRGASFDDGSILNIDDKGVFALTKEIGVNSQVDLRKGEVDMSSSLLGSECDYSSFSMNYYRYLINNTYYVGWDDPNQERGIYSGQVYASLASCLKTIANNLSANKCTYLHCTWGADRTGTVAMIIEALCGMRESDIVKDWELTSFSYCKRLIDNKDSSLGGLTYRYYDANKNIVKDYSMLRGVFEDLYQNYGGASGATLKQQVQSWLKAKVFSSEKDKGQSVMDAICDNLVTAKVKSPCIVQAVGTQPGQYKYVVTNQSSESFSAVENTFYGAKTGLKSKNDQFCATGLIDCKDYGYILVNRYAKNVPVFYDSNKKVIAGTSNDIIETNVAGYRQFVVPANAAYARFNFPKCSDWTAVLSVDSYF